MAVETPCQTPGAVFRTSINPTMIAVVIDLPEPLDLDDLEAQLLEDNLHNALEMVLARYFPRRTS